MYRVNSLQHKLKAKHFPDSSPIGLTFISNYLIMISQKGVVCSRISISFPIEGFRHPFFFQIFCDPLWA